MGILIEATTPEVPKSEPTAEQVAANPLDSAALLFKMYYPRFSRELSSLSVKSLRRLIRAWIGVPLEEASPNLKNQEEMVAYSIGERLLEAKMVVTLHTLYQHAQQFQNAEETTTSEECTTTTSVPTEMNSVSES